MERLSRILHDLDQGNINVESAKQQILNLFGVSVLLPSTEEIEKVSRARFKGRNHIKWKSEIFKAGANWMKSVVIGYSDVVGSVVAQSEQAVCGHPKPWKNTPWGYKVCPECNDIVEWEQTAP